MRYSFPFLLGVVLLSSFFPTPTHAFIIDGQPPAEAPRFINGIWHGLLAPYALLGGWIVNDHIRMYATPNVGRTYDLGFLLGVCGSVHMGWLAAGISTVGHLTGWY